MIQLYLLSVLCNGLAGYVLYAGSDSNIEKPQFIINNPTFYLVLGILSVVTGILKLLSPIKGFFILGDLVPAAAGIIAGIVLIFGLYRQNTDSKPGELERISTNLLGLRRPLGLGLMALALIHFIFAELIFL